MTIKNKKEVNAEAALPSVLKYTLNKDFLVPDSNGKFNTLIPGVIDKIIERLTQKYGANKDQYTLQTEIVNDVAVITVTRKDSITSYSNVRDRLKKILPKLWGMYKRNVKAFSIRLKEILNELDVSWSEDGKWLQEQLEKMTRTKWLVDKTDFTVAQVVSTVALNDDEKDMFKRYDINPKSYHETLQGKIAYIDQFKPKNKIINIVNEDKVRFVSLKVRVSKDDKQLLSLLKDKINKLDFVAF